MVSAALILIGLMFHSGWTLVTVKLVMLLFFPKGGLVSTMPKRSPGSEIRLSLTTTGLSSPPMPCKNIFITHSRAVLSTISQPLKVSYFKARFWSRFSL